MEKNNSKKVGAQIKRLVAQAKLIEAIEKVIIISEENEMEYLNEAIILSMELIGLKRDRIGSVLNKDDERLLKRQIALRMLELIDNIFK